MYRESRQLLPVPESPTMITLKRASPVDIRLLFCIIIIRGGGRLFDHHMMPWDRRRWVIISIL
jgi:hypothetical protein